MEISKFRRDKKNNSLATPFCAWKVVNSSIKHAGKDKSFGMSFGKAEVKSMQWRKKQDFHVNLDGK